MAGKKIPVETVMTARDVNVAQAWEKLARSADKYTRGVQTAYGAFDKLQTLSLGGFDPTAGILDLGSGVLGMAKSLVKINQELENTTNNLAGSIQVYKFGENYADSLLIASGALQQIKKDAASLPGTDTDFIRAFSITFPAQAQAGVKSLDEAIKRSDNLTAVLLAKGVDSGQIGRDLALMIKGHAGADVRSFMELQGQLGVKDAAAFNALDTKKRMAKLDEVINKNKDVIKAFGTTWEAATSTSQSYFKELVQVGSAPLFEIAKKNVIEMNQWFEKSKPKIMDLVNLYGALGIKHGGALINRVLDSVDTAITPKDYATRALESSVGPAFDRIIVLGDHILDLLPDAANLVSTAGSAIVALGISAIPTITEFGEALVKATGGILGFAVSVADKIAPPTVEYGSMVFDALKTDVKATSDYLTTVGNSLDPRQFKKHWDDLFNTMIEATSKGQTGLEAWTSFLDLVDSKEARARDALEKRAAKDKLDSDNLSNDRKEEAIERALFDEKEKQWETEQAKKRADKLKKPPAVVQDFRGSKFSIEQKFAQGFDPGRVLTAVREDSAKLAQRRLSAGNTPLFGGG